MCCMGKQNSYELLASIFTLAVTVNSCIRADVGRISPHVALLAVQNAGGPSPAAD